MKPKVAIVHDWFVTYAGAERVVEQLLECFPDADLFSLIDVLPDNERGFIKNKKVTTTFLQKFPWVKEKYRSYLPFMPMAIEQLDLSGYDIVLSSSHCVAKGVIVGPDQFHVSYVYTPVRYGWDFQFQYLRETGMDKGLKGWIAKFFLHRLRVWDTTTANRVDHFITLSKFIARRIQKTYRRDAEIIAPPVNVEDFTFHPEKEDFYVAASRLVPYKRLDLIVDAFTLMSDKKLVVIGDGPELSKIQKKAENHSNITIMGFQPFSVLRDHMQRAKAFLYGAEDDFSIVMIEAQACGTPAIAYGKGAALEIIKNKERGDAVSTGVFFDEQTPESVVKAVEQFESQSHEIRPKDCRENAEQYAPEIFRDKMKASVMHEYDRFREGGKYSELASDSSFS